MIGTYTPSVFDVSDIDAAKRIILTPERTQSTEERWNKETPYIMELVKQLHLTSQSAVLDFGCGIGRISKEIIKEYDCTTVGMDISMNMRGLANVYVNHNKFSSVSPSMKCLLPQMFDGVVAIWALQHVLNLDQEIEHIKQMMTVGGRILVINERRRFIPTAEGWMDDSKDIFIALQRNFTTEKIDVLDSNIVDVTVPERTFWGVFINK